jgi:hypothetical protein
VRFAVAYGAEIDDRSRMLRTSVLAVAFVLACGGGSSTDFDAQPAGPDAWSAPDGYTKLIERSWSIPPGSFDTYKCVRVTIPQDTYITNIIARAPAGTHHTVLSIAGGNGSSGPDGEQDCGVGTLGMVMLYASGVGTSPLDFPDGVGIKVSAGQQIHLNLHLFNSGDTPLEGESGIYVKMQTTPPAQIAEMVFAGTFLVNIPSNNTPTPVTGSCTESNNYSLFAVWPHMHQTARHQKVELVRNSVTTTLHDEDYSFNEQRYWLQSPIVDVQAGDQVKVTCTYVNNTGATIHWGDSSNEEMCFAGLYRFPAQNQGIYECGP